MTYPWSIPVDPLESVSAASNCYGPSLPRDCDLLEEIERAKNQFPPSPKTILNILESLVRRMERKPESAKPPQSTINTSDIIFAIEGIQDTLCGGDGRVMDCLRRLNELKQKLDAPENHWDGRESLQPRRQSVPINVTKFERDAESTCLVHVETGDANEATSLASVLSTAVTFAAPVRLVVGDPVTADNEAHRLVTAYAEARKIIKTPGHPGAANALIKATNILAAIESYPECNKGKP